MITKYVVKDDHIDLYEGEEIIAQVPNNEGNEDYARYFNNLVFITKDLDYANKREHYYNVKLKRSAVLSLVFGVLTCINLGSFNALVFFMLMYNLFNFIMNKGRHNESAKRVSYYQEVQKKIQDKLNGLRFNENQERTGNCSLEFTNEQITMDHEEWVKKIGDYYDYQEDLNTINNSKMLIKLD